MDCPCLQTKARERGGHCDANVTAQCAVCSRKFNQQLWSYDTKQVECKERSDEERLETNSGGGGGCCLNAEGAFTFQSQTSLSLQLIHLSQVTRFLFFSSKKTRIRAHRLPLFIISSWSAEHNIVSDINGRHITSHSLI